MNSTPPSSKYFVQKQLFKGSQRFEITGDDQIVVLSRGAGNERSYKLSLLEIDPRFARVKQAAWVPLIGAIVFGVLFVLVLFGSLFHLRIMKPDDFAGLIFGVFMIGLITLFYFRAYLRKVVDVVAFYSRANGQAVILLWHGKPPREACDGFVHELETRINAAVARAIESQPRDSMAGEIRALKKLVTDGLLSEAEFEKAKQKLLEEPRVKGPIGFSPEKA